MRARALRNFGVMAHVDAGKTTISERLLFLTGRIHRIGEVHHGDTALDHSDLERRRGITIGAAAVSVTWDDHQLNLIDTPGHVDFAVEVERSLRVLDGAVAVFDAVAGVEPQSESVWRQADRHNVPRLAFVNKMDRPGADLANVVDELRTVLGATPAMVQIPVFDDTTMVGVVDVISGTRWRWGSTDPEDVTIDDLGGPDDRALAHQLAAARVELVELLAERDEALFECWAEGSAPLEEIRAALRRLTIAGEVVPVLCGSALAGVGMQPLLDAIVAYLPAPEDRPVLEGRDDTLTALAFKVGHGTGRKLTWVRLYTGELAAGDRVLNASTGTTERVSRLVRLDAGSTVDVDVLRAGDIGAVIGLGSTSTGHTLCAPESPVVLESMEFPEPVIAMAIEPRSNDDQARLSTALGRLTEEDPTFAVRVHPETGQTLIAGMGELHLQVLVQRLADDHRVEVITGAPEVAYRETITRAVEGVAYRLKKQTGGPGTFAEVRVDLSPTDDIRPGVLEFVDATTGGAVPKEYANAVAAGAREAMSNGPVQGYPLVGVKLTLVDGAVHPNDSSERAFHQAGALVLREAAALAAPVRLEPVMLVTIDSPDESVGAAVGLVGARRGQLRDVAESDGSTTTITARVPLAELFGFTDALRSVSQGRASASLTPDGYEPG